MRVVEIAVALIIFEDSVKQFHIQVKDKFDLEIGILAKSFNKKHC